MQLLEKLHVINVIITQLTNYYNYNYNLKKS
jgi:hypothetical protein